ncbi:MULTISPECIES: ABC transporter permease [Chromobacteriaceae]|uniref:Peptide ABC transporter permease n=1 Tax=Pseudogulbenkiania ferrooxidans EGD-HP2 TaxID=1388764 RepID=A0ABN0NA09_9NEIS|nr:MULTISPECIES: ABC transporter permease [Chromobacteriaceae]AVG17571.1 ABC transporter permease [Chromobacterium vaccinii]ERE16355.1 peptide ABC transporter permease [Pseudogulbenkiania ferrooxidans EGD-HP2]
MTTLQNTAGATPAAVPSRSLWALGWQRLKRDRIGFACLWIVSGFMLLALCSWVGLIGRGWNAEVAVSYAPPAFLYQQTHESSQASVAKKAETITGVALRPEEDPIWAETQAAMKNRDKYVVPEVKKAESLTFGADIRGRDILDKVVKGTSTSLFVGFFGALLSVVIGASLGACAGFLGRKIDDFLMWFYNVFTAMPDMLLLLAFAAVAGRGLGTVILVLSLTSWPGTFRLVRAEFIKLRSREFVQAADAIGASSARRMFVHILPNVSHLLLVQFSLLMVGLIKYEVILSFLGFGVDVRQVSWGSMLSEVPEELMQGYWWQLAMVVVFMSLLVTAFSMLTDSLRDALDPKVK